MHEPRTHEVRSSLLKHITIIIDQLLGRMDSSTGFSFLQNQIQHKKLGDESETRFSVRFAAFHVQEIS